MTLKEALKKWDDAKIYNLLNSKSNEDKNLCI
jgi:hypothetical protein